MQFKVATKVHMRESILVKDRDCRNARSRVLASCAFYRNQTLDFLKNMISDINALRKSSSVLSTSTRTAYGIEAAAVFVNPVRSLLPEHHVLGATMLI